MCALPFTGSNISSSSALNQPPTGPLIDVSSYLEIPVGLLSDFHMNYQLSNLWWWEDTSVLQQHTIGKKKKKRKRTLSSSVKSPLVITGSSEPSLWLEKNQCVHCGGFSLWAHAIFKRKISDKDIRCSKIYLLLDLFQSSRRYRRYSQFHSQVNTTFDFSLLFFCVIKRGLTNIKLKHWLE